MKTGITLLCVALGACEATPKALPSGNAQDNAPIAKAQEQAREESLGLGPRSHLVKGIKGPEDRALVYLKPFPTIGVGLAKGVELEDLRYLKHSCWLHPQEGLVCTACYAGPHNYSGSATILCPPEVGTECTYVHTLPDGMVYNIYGVDPEYCDRKG